MSKKPFLKMVVNREEVAGKGVAADKMGDGAMQVRKNHGTTEVEIVCQNNRC